jgi:hypothetical protein
MESNLYHLQSIKATVAFSDDGCMICINAQPIKMSFTFDGTNIFCSSGQLIEIPQQLGIPSPEYAIVKIKELFEKNPDSVFIAEFGPVGPIADHPITIISSKKKIVSAP